MMYKVNHIIFNENALHLTWHRLRLMVIRKACFETKQHNAESQYSK